MLHEVFFWTGVLLEYASSRIGPKHSLLSFIFLQALNKPVFFVVFFLAILSSVSENFSPQAP